MTTQADAIRYLIDQVEVLALAVENLANGSPIGARRAMKDYKSVSEFLERNETMFGSMDDEGNDG